MPEGRPGARSTGGPRIGRPRAAQGGPECGAALLVRTREAHTVAAIQPYGVLRKRNPVQCADAIGRGDALENQAEQVAGAHDRAVGESHGLQHVEVFGLVVQGRTAETAGDAAARGRELGARGANGPGRARDQLHLQEAGGGEDLLEQLGQVVSSL